MNKVMKEIFSASTLNTVLAVVASFVFGGVLIAFANENVQVAAGYLFARPADFFLAIWNAVFGAYDALFRGSVFNYKLDGIVAMVKPITETLAYATPITLSGLKREYLDSMRRTSASAALAASIACALGTPQMMPSQGEAMA